MADDRRDLHPDVKKPPNTTASNDALKFFKWAYDKGDKMAQDLDYIPMPDNVVALVEKMWAADIAARPVDRRGGRVRKRRRAHGFPNARLKIRR